ncbi:phage portal protein [Methylobrevis pamukkalensis]|uniref:Phage portal protein n=1 Tax=Methylobrevis pamukkalensis TaxID=1439726 RepID=A0A1E3GXV6_9HYPH|nr:phage portal protein [Methylobrevis pamukkalensis]ODN68854.1 Phage portal protein [Methylobrevis pamukkalensis]
MSFWNPFRRSSPNVETRDATLASPDAALFEIFGSIVTAAGEAVSPETAMRCTAVRCAVETIAETIGQLPVHVYARDASGAKERAPDHPAYRLLHDEANDWTPAPAMFEQITRDALLYGNGFLYINRVDGAPFELLRIAPKAMTVEVDSVTGEPVYRSNTSPARTYDRGDLIHIRAPSCDGIRGESPVMACREAIGLALVMEKYAGKLFGNGARPSGVLKFPKVLGDAAASRIVASWKAAHSGGENAGRTALIEDGGEFQSIALSSVDAQFLEMRHFAIEEIARVFRVPPHLLFELGRATWGNASEMGAAFLTYSLMRWLKVWQGELRLKLFTPDERRTYFPEFLVDDLLRADLAARADAYGKLIAARVLNPNEARAMENRPPYAGGDVFANPNTTAGAAADTGGNPDA